MTTQAPVTVLVDVETEVVEAHLRDCRLDAVAVFAPLDAVQRAGLAVDAWTVGLRALTNAYRQAEESKLEDIGKALVQDVDAELTKYVARQQEIVTQALKRYFDPRDGQLVTRIEGFLEDGGELSQAMGTYLSPETGALATILSKALGENSPLLRRLSATDSESVVLMIEARVREALEANHAAVAKALDPLAADGAVARFLGALRKDIERADTDRTKQLALATKALDANDESSLLSRLVRETQAASTAVLQAMNPDAAGSPLAILKTSLTAMLEKHAKSQSEVIASMDERQKKLDQEIREALTRLEERKRSDATSPRGGRRFEDQVLCFTHNALTGAPVVIEDTGATVGARGGCKVGDQVVKFTGESIYAGSAIVIEAKRDASYNVARALGELETARSNRTAQAAVFVMARSHAPVGFPSFARHGNDVLVIWDDADEGTDPYLQAAIFLALALATRQRRGEDEGNIKALADVERRIESELKRHEKMRDLAESIQKKAEDLLDELRKGTKGLNLMVRDAKATLKALNVELATAEEERAEPLALPAGDLEAARAALTAA